MNAKNIKALEKATSLIEEAIEIIESIKDSEEIVYEKMSDKKKESEKGEKQSQVIDQLDDAITGSQDAIEAINNATWEE